MKIGCVCFAITSVLCLEQAAVSEMRNSSVWNVVVVGSQSEQEQLATVDLQRYIGQVNGELPRIVGCSQWLKKPCPAIILGTPSNNELIARLIAASELSEQGFCLSNDNISGVKVIVAAGTTPDGAKNAIYGLLREVGFGFYLGSESIPESLPERLISNKIVRNPLLKIRGVLPWYNFFNSPTTWESVDHRSFVDQLVRSGANFIGFHSYDYEPFCGYKENGEYKFASRLLNTGAPTWGTTPVATDGFGFGTGKLFADKFFGARTTLDIADANQAIETEQNILRDALDYAKRRGLKTCVGFEYSGDPTKAADRETFLKRINHVLNQYPAIDYLWVWSSETQGAQGYCTEYYAHSLPSILDINSPIVKYGEARRDVFDRVIERTLGAEPYFQNTDKGKKFRAVEGARMEQYASLAYNALSQRKDAPRLVISGWGGEDRLLSAEYYDGLDKVLPKDVVFASLDFIVPRPNIDSIYGELPADRERWPIPWLEYDGDQWQPQPAVKVYEGIMGNVEKSGSQGVLGIHWRTRDLDENFGFVTEYCWNPGLTAREFFVDFARKAYPKDIADKMAAVHLKLDSLGYRWVNGWGQTECCFFSWNPGDDGKAEKLAEIRREAAGLLADSGRGKTRLEWLIDVMDWVLGYHRAEKAVVKVQQLVTKANEVDPAAAKAMGEEAIAVMEEADFGKTLQKFAKRLSTRGEYGVLATVNTKAYPAWKCAVAEAYRVAGKPLPAEVSDAWSMEPDIVLPRFFGSVAAGEDLEINPVVLGGGKAWAHWRKIGDDKWLTAELQPVKDWVYKVVIPGVKVTQPGIEIGFSFSSSPDSEMIFEPIAVTVMPKTNTNTEPFPLKRMADFGSIKLDITRNKTAPVELRWNMVPGVDFYRVLRDGKPVVETGAAFFPDYEPTDGVVYQIEAIRDGEVVTRSENIRN